MATDLVKNEEKHIHKPTVVKKETNWTKRVLITVMFLYLSIFLLVPLVYIFAKLLNKAQGFILQLLQIVMR